jgi:hypothetical protein
MQGELNLFYASDDARPIRAYDHGGIQQPAYRKVPREMSFPEEGVVDLDGNAEQHEFHRAVIGKPYPIPADLWETTEVIEGRDFILERCVRAIWDYNKHQRIYALPRGYMPCIDLVAHGMGLDPERVTLEKRPVRQVFWAMCSLALAKARQDVRYWGVEDQEKESYCSSCREVKPLSQFITTQWICEDCIPTAQKRKEDRVNAA